MIRSLPSSFAAVFLLSAGCGSVDGPASQALGTDYQPSEPGQTGLALRGQVPVGIGGVRFVVTRVPCGDEEVEPDERVRGLQRDDLAGLEPLPGEVPGGADAPPSGGLIADHFELLPAGCYDVLLQVLGPDGEPLPGCSPAQATRVEVSDAQTTEIVLVTRCTSLGPVPDPDPDPEPDPDPPPPVNGPPTVTGITYDATDQPYECEPVEVCVTAEDLEGDLIEFIWQQTSGPLPAREPEATAASSDGNAATRCVRIVPTERGTYTFAARVYDLVDTVDGRRRREDVLADLGVGEGSHDEVTLTLDVSWDVDIACYAPDVFTLRLLPGVRRVTRDSGCGWHTPSLFYCDPEQWADTAVTCPGGRFAPAAVYQACE